MRVPRTLPKVLSPADVNALLGALRCHRDRAMVLAMVLGGLRGCEVLGLRLADIQVPQRSLFIAEGKGGHHRGMRLEAIAALLGHRSLEMTLVYARIADRVVAHEYASGAPRSTRSTTPPQHQARCPPRSKPQQ